MPKSIVNLTRLVVDAEIEQILAAHYHHPYQHIFADLDIRQELVAYVLTRTCNIHISVEQGEESRLDAETMPYLTEAKLQIEELIHGGIYHILQKYKTLVSYCLTESYSHLALSRQGSDRGVTPAPRLNEPLDCYRRQNYIQAKTVWRQ